MRADTAQQHERVDSLFSALDIGRARPLERFFRANLSALEAVRVLPGPHRDLAAELRGEMQAALTADLRHLGTERGASLQPRELDATAVLYVLLGSRAGTRVLRRRWQETEDAAVAAAGRYFALDPRRPSWRALCEELARTSPHGPVAEAVVGDARTIFDLYLAGWAANAPATGALHA